MERSLQIDRRFQKVLKVVRILYVLTGAGLMVRG